MASSPLGAQEIADLLGVQDRTVHQWIRRRLMPEADHASVNGSRAWERKAVIRWAGNTGRLTDPERIAEYVALTGHEPRAPRKGGRLPADLARRRAALPA